jgi:hypothetical protein
VRLNLAGTGFVTAAEAAAILQVSPQAIGKAARSGRLEFELRDGVRVFRREGLERRWWGSTQRLADLPERAWEALEYRPTAEEVANWANALLVCEAWSGPPWTADRWVTLLDVIQTAQELAARWPYSPEAMQQWESELERELNEHFQRLPKSPSAG